MDVGEVVKTEELTTTVFTDNGDVDTVSFINRTIHASIPIEYESIKDFLSKPLLINTFVWTTASAINTQLFTEATRTTLLSTAYWTNKMQGFGLIRGTVNYKVVINATPFVQGELLIRYVPCYADNTNASTDYSFLFGPNSKLEVKTQTPHVYLNCRESSAELSHPYINPKDFYEFVDGTSGDWGTLFIDVLAPLKTGSTLVSDVEVSIYAYFTDVELAAPMVAQSKESAIARAHSKDLPSLESKVQAKGTISKSLSIVSKAASSFAEIPALAAVAGPAAWVTDALSGVASFFGYSKPPLDTAPHVVARHNDHFGATSTGTGCEYPLAMRHDNALTTTKDLSIRDVDELSWTFLKGVEAWNQTINWATSNVTADSLLSANLNPAYLGNTYTNTTIAGHTVTYKVGPPAYYYSNIFKYWRGSISLRIKIIKTQFHTGRLQIVWTPSSTINVTPGLVNSIVALREIIDITTSDEINLDLPYYVPLNYLPMTGISGQLQIRVLNQLRAPETCSQDVQLVLFFKGGADLEFQVPTTTTVKSVYVAHAKSLTSSCVGNSGECGYSSYPAESSIGEIFTSLRQLLNRYTQIYFKDNSIIEAPFYIWPWFSSGISQDGTTGLLLSPNHGGDIFSMVAPCYAFMRGGMKVRFDRVGTADGASSSVHASLIPIAVGLGPIGTANPTPGTGSLINWNTASTAPAIGITDTDVNVGPLPFMVPYQSQYKCALTYMGSNFTNGAIQKFTPTQSLNITGTIGVSNSSLYRAIAEDFNFSYFIACPPLFISTT
jgi:hypothetical protein